MNLTERGQGSHGENFKTLPDFFKQGLKLYYVYGETQYCQDVNSTLMDV